MKKLAICTCLLLLAASVSAQHPGRFRPEQLDDEEIIRIQTRDIVYWLELEGQTKDKFIAEYSAFRKEIDGVAKNARPPQNIEGEDEIDKAIQKNFEVSEQILQIRKKYYLRFKQFLMPSQIQTMYRIEREAGRRMHGGPGGPNGPEGHGDHGNPPMPPRP